MGGREFKTDAHCEGQNRANLSSVKDFSISLVGCFGCTASDQYTFTLTEKLLSTKMFGFALRMMILGLHLNSRSKLTVEGIPNNVMSWPITKPMGQTQF